MEEDKCNMPTHSPKTATKEKWEWHTQKIKAEFVGRLWIIIKSPNQV